MIPIVCVITACYLDKLLDIFLIQPCDDAVVKDLTGDGWVEPQSRSSMQGVR